MLHVHYDLVKASIKDDYMFFQQIGAALTTYAYDGDGLRRRMVTSGGTTTFVWDGTDYLGEVK